MANSSKLSSVYEEVEIRKFEGLSSLNPYYLPHNK